MQTRVLQASETKAIVVAYDILNRGGLVAFPTDTVYGLGAVVFNSKAVGLIYLAKGRSQEKALPVLIGSQADLKKVIEYLPPMAIPLTERFWPGPLSIILPKHKDIPEAVSATSTIAVRIPDHPIALKLLQRTGPMAVTSANRSDQPNSIHAAQVLQMLAGRIDLVLDGGPAPGGLPSTLVDCTGIHPVILRRGPISEAEILAVLD